MTSQKNCKSLGQEGNRVAICVLVNEDIKAVTNDQLMDVCFYFKTIVLV